MADIEYEFRVIEFDNYDGDSFDLTLDLGFNLVVHHKCRLHGVDTPELRSRDPLHKAAGYLARERVHTWCQAAMSEGHLFFVSECYTGKYGRPLGDLVREEENPKEPGEIISRSLRDFLLTFNYGVPYGGEAKSKIAHLHQRNFEILQGRNEI